MVSISIYMFLDKCRARNTPCLAMFNRPARRMMYMLCITHSKAQTGTNKSIAFSTVWVKMTAVLVWKCNTRWNAVLLRRPLYDTIRNDTVRDYIFTCAQMLTWVPVAMTVVVFSHVLRRLELLWHHEPGLFSCRPHSLELSLGFHPRPDHQCRLFKTFA